MTNSRGFSAGLEGVIVAETTLSEVDGARGRLIIAGDDVESLAGQITFEELAAKLWNEPEDWVRKQLGEARLRAHALIPKLGQALEVADGMDSLRAATAQLSPRGSREDGPWLAGALATFASAWSRAHSGQPILEPRAEVPHAQDYLRMLSGKEPSRTLSDRLDAYLVTVSDHGMNASTFAARVVSATGSDAVSAVTAAIGALKGPLHGGAPGPVLDMLDAIGDAARAERWILSELDAGRRIMGVGHRIYRVRDPRASVLEKQIEQLERGGQSGQRLSLARAVERAATRILRERHPDRPLNANVEFYTAVLLEAVGLPRTLFTPTFAVGRVAGWWAHIEEQRRSGRLIRPESRYVGKRPAEG
jgi:citrate synthase